MDCIHTTHYTCYIMGCTYFSYNMNNILHPQSTLLEFIAPDHTPLIDVPHTTHTHTQRTQSTCILHITPCAPYMAHTCNTVYLIWLPHTTLSKPWHSIQTTHNISIPINLHHSPAQHSDNTAFSKQVHTYPAQALHTCPYTPNMSQHIT